MPEEKECTHAIRKIDLSDLDRKFCPAKWEYVLSKSDKAYAADVPTLKDIELIYGEEVIVHWLRGQVTALFGASANSDRGIADGISIFSQSFAMQIRGYKLSEIMLFFAKYKAGRYDNSYSTFDARRIGNAFFKEFVPERSYEIDAIERKRIQEEIERRRFYPPKGYTSFTWYQKVKEEAEKGQEWAINELKGYGNTNRRNL